MGIESITNEENIRREVSLETLPGTDSPHGTTEHILTLEDGTRLTITGELKMQGPDHMSLTGNSEDGTTVQVVLHKEDGKFSVEDISYPDQAQAA